MSRSAVTTIVWSIALAAVLSAGAASALERNAVRLGSFECADSEFRIGWEIPWGQTASIDDTVAHSGKRSLRLDGSDGREDVSARQFIPVDTSHGGRLFDVSLWMKMSGVVRGTYEWETARCYLSTFDAQDKLMSLEEVNLTAPAIGTHDWRRVSRLMTVPLGAAKACLYLSLCRSRGTLWFDDVQMLDISDRLGGDEPSSAVVHVDSLQTVGKLSCGMGWNWLTVRPSDLSVEAAATWPDLFRGVDYNGDDWVRIGIWPAYYAPRNYSAGADTGQRYDYSFDNPYSRRVCELLQRLKDRRIDALLTVWRLSFDSGEHFRDVPNATWLLGLTYDPSTEGKPEAGLPYSDRRFAEGLAAYVRYLRVDKGLTNVKYVSIWNEPYQNWIGTGASWHDRFYRIYGYLDEELRKQGMRGYVSILGTEECGSGSYALGVAGEVVRRKSPIDVVAVHDYDAGMDAPTDVTSQYPASASANAYGEAASLLRKSGRSGTPIAITEIGAYGPGEWTGERANLINVLGMAEYVVRCLNAGVGGFLRWQYNIPGPAPVSQHFAFEQTGKGIAENPGQYWGWAAMMRWTIKGSSILRARVSVRKDALGFERISAAALRSPQGCTTVIVVNTGRRPKTITVTGLSRRHRYAHYLYDLSIPGRLRSGRVVSRRGGQIVDAPAESISILTDFPTGLNGPAPR